MKRDVFKVHSVLDDALASIAPTVLAEYGSSRDAGDLPDGVADHAITYHFRRLTRRQYSSYVQAGSTDSEKMLRAFMAGVIRISGGDAPAEGWAPENVDDDKRTAMTEAEADALEDLGVYLGAMTDIGQVVFTRSVLSPKADPVFPLPEPRLLVWDAAVLPSAEPSQADADQNSEEPSED